MNKAQTPKLLLAVCILAYVSGGAMSMLMSVYLPSVVEDLLGSSDEATMSAYGPWLNAAYLAGMTAGGLAIGAFSDRFGRVPMLSICLALSGLCTYAATLAPDWVIVTALRSIAGVGVAGILLTCAVLISEHWPEEGRAVAQGYLGVAFPVGIVLAGSLNVVFADWRAAFAMGWAPVLLAPVVWALFGSKYNAVAPEVLAKSSKNTLFHPENRLKLLIGGIVYGFDLIGLWAIFSWMPTWVGSMVADGERAGQVRGLTMMLLGIGGMVGTGLSGHLVDRLGLRRALLANFTGTLALCLFIFLTTQGYSNLILVEIAVLSLFFGISQGALTVYVTELFPTEIRATGTGFCFNIGRIFTTFAVFFVGALVSVLGGYAEAMLAFSGAFAVAWAALYFDKNGSKTNDYAAH